MKIHTSSHGTGHSSDTTTTTIAVVNDSTGNTRKFYILLYKECSSTILRDNYLNNVNNIKKSKSQEIVLQVPPSNLVGLPHIKVVQILI